MDCLWAARPCIIALAIARSRASPGRAEAGDPVGRRPSQTPSSALGRTRLICRRASKGQPRERSRRAGDPDERARRISPGLLIEIGSTSLSDFPPRHTSTTTGRSSPPRRQQQVPPRSPHAGSRHASESRRPSRCKTYPHGPTLLKRPQRDPAEIAAGRTCGGLVQVPPFDQMDTLHRRTRRSRPSLGVRLACGCLSSRRHA